MTVLLEDHLQPIGAIKNDRGEVVDMFEVLSLDADFPQNGQDEPEFSVDQPGIMPIGFQDHPRRNWQRAWSSRNLPPGGVTSYMQAEDPLTIIGQESPVEKVVIEQDTRHWVRLLAYKKLTSRERYVISARLGLDDQDPMSQQEVSDTLLKKEVPGVKINYPGQTVTKERVREIESGALKKIRCAIHMQGVASALTDKSYQADLGQKIAAIKDSNIKSQLAGSARRAHARIVAVK
jgi:hypothetical protein